jgi:hypothetical protein
MTWDCSDERFCIVVSHSKNLSSVHTPAWQAAHVSERFAADEYGFLVLTAKPFVSASSCRCVTPLSFGGSLYADPRRCRRDE